MTDADGSDWPPIRRLRSESDQEQPKIHVAGYEPTVERELTPAEIHDEVRRRGVAHGEWLMAHRRDDHELLDDYEQACGYVDRDQHFAEDRAAVEYVAALLGVRVRWS